MASKDPEVKAMQSIDKAMSALSPTQKKRVLAWLFEKQYDDAPSYLTETANGEAADHA